MGSDDVGLLVLAGSELLVLACDELFVLVLVALVLECELSGGGEWGLAGSYNVLLSAWRRNLDPVVLFWRHPISVHTVGIFIGNTTIVVVGYRGVVGGVLQS